MTEQHWYQEFFGKTYLKLYAPRFSAAATERQVDFIVRELELTSGMRLLDLCCGQGRHVVPLAQRGMHVVGQDLSGALLAAAKRSASAAGVSPEFVERDMREIDWTGEFDAVINVFTAFGYFEDDSENQRVLDGVAKALKGGGRFLIDVVNYAWLMQHWRTHGWNRADDGTLELETCRIDWRTGMNEVDHEIVYPDGHRHTITNRLRLFASHELVAWIERAGLCVLKLLGSWGGQPYGREAPRLIVVAQKPKSKRVHDATRDAAS